MKRGLFLDRDGVITELVYYASHGEWESPRRVADVRFCPGVFEALREATARGWLVFLVTNQPSYAKGKCSLEDLQQVHQTVLQRLAEEGVRISDSYVCYHHPESTIPGYGACQCRKPSPFFIQQAARDWGVDLKRSWMAGDRATDVEAGRRAGCRTALVEYEHSRSKRDEVEADLVCAGLAELVRKID